MGIWEWGSKHKQPEPTPIADTLKRAADNLGIKTDDTQHGLLLMALIIEELSRRVGPHLK